MGDIPYGYDFGTNRHNVMISSSGQLQYVPSGFDLEEVGHLKYGQRHVWDFAQARANDVFGRRRVDAAGEVPPQP